MLYMVQGFSDDALEEIVVLGEKKSASEKVEADIEEALKRVPGATNLVLPDTSTRLATLKDTLSFQAGVLLQEFSGGNDMPRLNIRGSGIQGNPVSRGVLLRQDYLPLNEADGSFILGLIEPRASQFISISPGANSRALGPATLGGDINFISTNGDGPDQFVGRLESGSYGRNAVFLSNGADGVPLADTVSDYRVSVSDDSYDGYREHSESQRRSLRANIGWELSPTLTSRTYVSHTDLEFEFPFALNAELSRKSPEGVVGENDFLRSTFEGLSYELTPEENINQVLEGLNPNTAAALLRELPNIANHAADFWLNTYQRDPRRKTETWRYAQRTVLELNDSTHYIGIYRQTTEDLFIDPLSHANSDIETRGLQWQMERWFNELKIDLGVSWDHSDFRRRYATNNPENGSPYVDYADLDMTAENSIMQVDLFYTFNEDWSANVQYLLGQSSRDIHERMTDEERQEDWHYGTPKIGMMYQSVNDYRLFANFSESKEIPSFWELIANKTDPTDPTTANIQLADLDIQKAQTIELGGAGSILQNFHWQLTFYRSELEDELLSTAGSLGLIDETINYDGNTVHQGIEAMLHGEAAGKDLYDKLISFNYRFAWTYSHFTFDNGEYSGNKIAGVPLHFFQGELLIQQGAWLYGPTFTISSEDNPVDHSNTVLQEKYQLIGFKISYKPTSTLDLYLLGENLTDETYASAYVVRSQGNESLPTFLPGNGRSINFGFSYNN